MIDHETRAIELTRWLIEWLALSEKDPHEWPAMTKHLAEQSRAVEREELKAVEEYAEMRRLICDNSKHVEKLAGNIVKEAREDGAIAELNGLEQWCRAQGG